MSSKIKSGIYLIKNMINGKVYVGSSTDIMSRKYAHFSTLRKNKHGSSHLQYAFNKYGGQNFEFYIIAYCLPQELLKKEDFYINYYESRNGDRGYNINGAERIVMSEETKKRISKSLTGRKRPPISEEHKRKISEKLRGRNVTLMTEEIKQKISKALKGKYKERKRAPFTEEHKRKLSQALIGRKLHPLSSEHKEKISKSLRDRNNKDLSSPHQPLPPRT